ncbi:Aste57867_3506 [Aphanomyces stellatus]|uniref:Aste57867_3506 protein n=1 Tax=Aphanomyces stellatus TaxID=120398 RepID=A0A485KAW7_9STRA|nr:hypothetical protein As57867_003495 [Aphanomyces stellatus]VFT80669.1 Aste57867_3506 [Aphanomyces stellatus]
MQQGATANVNRVSVSQGETATPCVKSVSSARRRESVSRLEMESGDEGDYRDDDFLPDEHHNRDERAVDAATRHDDDDSAGETCDRSDDEATKDDTKTELNKDQSPSKRQGAIDEHHRKTLAAKEMELRTLYRKIGVYRKANAVLKKELESFHNNDTLAQLENKAREKQLLIEKLTHDNKYLVNLQRTQAKRIEELESLKEHFPTKHHSIMEELRICKETYRMYKEREKAADERSAKLHQQVVDLTAKNKGLADKIKQHEQSQMSSHQTADAVEAEADGELAQLQQRVLTLEKNKRTEKAKYDRVLKTCQEQLDECKREMERFQQALLDKDKELRHQVVELKKLKRQLRELAVDTQTSQQLCHFLSQRGLDPTSSKPKAAVVPMPPPPSSEKRPAQPTRIQKPKPTKMDSLI